LLLDTHIIIRWISDTKKLSRDQSRTLESAVQRGEPLAFSAMSLLEIALLASGDKSALKASLDEVFEVLSSNRCFVFFP